MKLLKIRIQNFRSFKDETVYFEDLTTLVGPNGAGKSNVLTALNIFFRTQTSTLGSDWVLSDEDFHNKNVTEPIIVTLTFGDLNETAKQELKAYYRNNELTVSAQATWDAKNSGAEVRQYGARLVIGDFAKFFAADAAGAKVAELKQIYSELRAKFTDLPAPGAKAAMEEALRAYEESHPQSCELRESSDQFYGWRGESLLSKFIQWVYIPAVKDASTEQDESKGNALGVLLSRTIRSKVSFDAALKELKSKLEEDYKKILETQNSVLAELSGSLEKRLQEWARPGARVNLSWAYDPQKSLAVNEPYATAQVAESGFLGEVGRLGHGAQRTFIVSLLQELASGDAANAPTLLLGFEEPELYQHPPQARHLAAVLEELAAKGSQIITTTHSPYFVSSARYPGIRRVHIAKGASASKTFSTSIEKIHERLKAALPPDGGGTPTAVLAAVEQIMQPAQNEMFFATLPVLVEGPEDIGLISAHMHLSGQWRDFRKYGCHFVAVIGKSKLSRPLAIACEFGIPAYAVIDSDIKAETRDSDADNIRDNNCVLTLSGVAPLPSDHKVTHIGANAAMFAPTLLSCVMAELGADWATAETAARAALKMQNVAQKHPTLLAATLERLWAQGKKSAVLQAVSEKIISRAAATLN